jgi:predicted nucleic acid-binding protein
MPKRDISKPTYYLDACVLIDLIELPETHPASQAVARVLDEADEGKCNLVTSVLTIAEVLYAKHEIDGKALDPFVEAKIAELWHPSASPIQLVEVHELIARDANRLLRDHLCNGWTKTGTIDAVHLATAHREFATEFFTNEHAMKKWEDVMGFKVCAAHPATPADASLFSLPPAPAGPPPDDHDWLWRMWKSRQLASSAPSHGAQQSLRKS